MIIKQNQYGAAIAPTELRKTKQEIQSFYRSVESAGLGTWSINVLDDSITLCPRCRQMCNIPANACLTLKDINQIIKQEYIVEILNIYSCSKEIRGNLELELPITTHKDSITRWLRLTAIVVCEESGVPETIYGTAADISKKKNAELFKNDLLAIVSHDLRSPLSAVKLYVQMCMRNAVKSNDDFLYNAMKNADKQLVKMNAMIQAFLDKSVIQSGQIAFKPEAFDINELLEDVISDMRLLNPQKLFTIEPFGNLWVCADKNQISQILHNLLTNAVKYSPCGNRVIVTGKVIGGHLRIAVKDFGIGMKKEDQENIFNRFYRVKNDVTEGITGYGVGLYIAKQIILQHGGLMWVKSEENKGSTFYFTLPLIK